ncbi:hypothetical protein AcV7_003535 [Taiwanofungus camphoratus]|nr:hypothetical protein AcV7_003535 [Antrodia cinnamomea]
MSWVMPQQYQVWSQMPSAPPGWMGTWPPPAPPTGSGPPPAPAGVNPQAWGAGQWVLNPMYRGPMNGAQPMMQAWVPHPSWASQAGAAANWNPYKRVPNPGSAEYWSTKLVDNPLGLENMHIRDDTHEKTQENGVLHTPWVWAPRELRKSPERRESSDPHNGQENSNRPNGRPQDAHAHFRPQNQPSSEALRQSHRSHESYNGYSSTTQDSASRQSRLNDRQVRGSNTGPPPPPPVIPPPPDRKIPSSASAAVSSYSAYHQQQQPPPPPPPPPPPQHQRTQSRDVSPRPTYDAQQQSRDIRTSPNHSTSSSSASTAAAVTASSRPSGSSSASQPPAFTSKQELQPTFSPSIVRTPGHYSSSSTSTPTRRMSSDDSLSFSSTPSRRMSSDDADRTPSRHPVSPYAHGPIYAPATGLSRSNSVPKRKSSALATPSSSSNSNSDSTSGSTSSTSTSSYLPVLTNFSEEPAGLLSPLVSAPRSTSDSSPGSRELSRSHTHPTYTSGNTFESIPEDRATSQPHTPRPADRDRDPNATPYVNPRTPTHTSHVTPDSSSRHLSRSHTYPTLDSSVSSLPSTDASRTAYAPRSPGTSRSPYTSRSPTSASRSRGPSPSRNARQNHNPLPAPPMPSSYLTSSASMPVSLASASASAAAPQQPAYRRVRKGFWNRRGDHLTVERNGQYIVYAPRTLANPSELVHYPIPTEGFMDHLGNKIKYDPNVPELPQSLPLHGEPPSRPYEEFVQYVYV